MIKALLKKYGVEISEEAECKFERYYDYLIEKNNEFNLTAITEKNEVCYKHFLDSVLPVNSMKNGAKILDVGTGAGFPGIPLKIARDDLNIVLLDSLQKRVNFLNETISLLNLKNISAVHARVEDLKERESFDFVVSRAVSKSATLAEYTLPYVKLGGYAIFYKALQINEELKDAEVAIEQLGGKIEKIDQVFLEEIGQERNIVWIKKVKPCPKTYPRGKNLPKIKPIANKNIKNI